MNHVLYSWLAVHLTVKISKLEAKNWRLQTFVCCLFTYDVIKFWENKSHFSRPKKYLPHNSYQKSIKLKKYFNIH